MDYSFKDFTGRNLRTEKNLSGQIIEGSCFSQEKPDTVMFPDDMTGTTFLRCNLDNVFIPQGNTVIGGSQRRFKVQNDLQDWEVDEQNKPVKILEWNILQKQGLPLPDPKDIPLDKPDILKTPEEKSAEVADGIIS